VIEIHNLSKAYKEVQALKNLNLTVKQHSIFGLLGHNGAVSRRALSQAYGFLPHWVWVFGLISQLVHWFDILNSSHPHGSHAHGLGRTHDTEPLW
jgi:ABC-type uncharacterized transport system YnjBCD ATPase subunit